MARSAISTNNILFPHRNAAPEEKLRRIQRKRNITSGTRALRNLSMEEQRPQRQIATRTRRQDVAQGQRNSIETQTLGNKGRLDVATVNQAPNLLREGSVAADRAALRPGTVAKQGQDLAITGRQDERAGETHVEDLADRRLNQGILINKDARESDLQDQTILDSEQSRRFSGDTHRDQRLEGNIGRALSVSRLTPESQNRVDSGVAGVVTPRQTQATKSWKLTTAKPSETPAPYLEALQAQTDTPLIDEEGEITGAGDAALESLDAIGDDPQNDNMPIEEVVKAVGELTNLPAKRQRSATGNLLRGGPRALVKAAGQVAQKHGPAVQQKAASMEGFADIALESQDEVMSMIAEGLSDKIIMQFIADVQNEKLIIN